MKQLRICLLAVTVIVLLVSLAAAGAKDRNKTKTLSVEMLIKSPQKFVDKNVTVKGVVATVSAEKKFFTIVDAVGCGGCPSKKACGTAEMQVVYKGDLPNKKRIVKIFGRLIERGEGQYVIEANKIQ